MSFFILFCISQLFVWMDSQLCWLDIPMAYINYNLFAHNSDNSLSSFP